MACDPEISVLVVAHNKAKYTRRCLASVLAAGGARFEFLLFDNGSVDETSELLERFARQARAAGHAALILREDKNVGAIRSRNALLERATLDLVAFLDNDVMVRTRGWAGALAGALVADERIGMLAPKLVYPYAPYDIQCAGCDVSQDGRVGFRGRGRPNGEAEFNQPRDCQCLISACWLLRRATSRALGPLDERFSPVQFEDIDYCYRARARGLRAVYLPSVEMYHWENTTTAGSDRINYNYITVKNNARFKQKWRQVFEQENGPPDAGLNWQQIPAVGPEEVDDPPVV